MFSFSLFVSSGRRANCVLYGILYALACVTKHFNNFFILMIGRLLGGIATSILYSAFESWLVYEHNSVSQLRVGPYPIWWLQLGLRLDFRLIMR